MTRRYEARLVIKFETDDLARARSFYDLFGEVALAAPEASDCERELRERTNQIRGAPYKVLVTGGRAFADRRALFAALDRLHADRRITLIVHGACGATLERPDPPFRGADGIADDWALARGVNVDRHPADWTGRGKKAGPIRNRRMLALAPDVVVACAGGPGTAHLTSLARAAGVRLVIVERTDGTERTRA